MLRLCRIVVATGIMEKRGRLFAAAGHARRRIRTAGSRGRSDGDSICPSAPFGFNDLEVLDNPEHHDTKVVF